jgi:hypothetical protein
VYVWPGCSLNIPLGGNIEPRGTEETLVQDVCASVIASSARLEDLILNVIAIGFNISLQFPFGPDRFNSQESLKRL